MFEFAERVGYSSSKFEVEKQIFKLWFHNNKKKYQSTADVLHESMIHKILCYLSYGEAFRMRILSKTWLQAWLTHPNLKFRVCSSDENISIVDKIMERYRDGKIPIDKFEFLNNIPRPNGDVYYLIDKWFDIALQNGVKDIVYGEFTYYLPYPFPIFKFLAANSLRELVLTYCDLVNLSLSASHVVNCRSLRKLSLTSVTIDDNMLQTLLTSCPLIVNLIIHHCSRWKKFEVRNLQKIRSLCITTNNEQLVKIQAPTLEHLSYSSYSSEGLDIVEYHNLKSFELSCREISSEFIERLISRSHFLESLILVGVPSERYNIVRSESLRVLKIQSCQNIGVIDAPNLVSLEYGGYRIPRLKFAKESSKLKKFILDSSRYNLKGVWFSRLWKFLSNSTSWSQVSLIFSSCKDIDRKDLQLHSTPNVDVLDVHIIKSLGVSPTFVDALLWSCHPRRLNVSSTVKMIICFIDRLLYMKNSSHSTSNGSKPQLSQLKEVKAYKFDGTNENWHPVELRGELKTRNLDKMVKFYFLLDW